MEFEDGFGRNAPSPQVPRRALGSINPESHLPEAADNGRHRRFVTVVHGHENRPLERQIGSGPDLGFGKRHSKGVGNPHDFTGAPHLRAEHRVHVGQFRERKDGFLHRHVRQRTLVDGSHVFERPSGHHRRRKLHHRHAGCLADERYGPRSARIHLQHVYDAILHSVLHVDQPDHTKRSRELSGVLAHRTHRLLVDEIGRQHACGIA